MEENTEINNDKILKIKEYLGEKKKIVLLGLGIFFVLIILLIVLLFMSKWLGSTNSPEAKLTDYSSIKQSKSTNYFNLNTYKGYLYKSKKEGKDAVLDFITTSPKFARVTNLIPQDFAKNSEISKVVKDSNEHYFFHQKIDNIPVYGADLIVHLRNKNEIYSVHGNIVKNNTISDQKLSEDKAVEIALGKAKIDAGNNAELTVTKKEKNILNKKILGIEEDDTNYLTLVVTINSKTGLAKPFSKKYFVELNKGVIVYEEDMIIDALNRRVSGGGVSRTEGQGPTGDANVDKFYDWLGDVYSFYYDSFGRDSINGSGGSLIGIVNPPCHNAWWQGSTGTMTVCTDAMGLDVIAHEMTHGVTQHTAGLVYSYQSGALNESISDIFGSALDNNWTMAEGTGLGILRDMSNPPSRNSPDKLSSPLYVCSSIDNGGVHSNSGVLNKTYYLMTDGGSFNGCTINGLGRQKANAVVYKALTSYLSSAANFKAMYGALLQACNDLYTSSSAECDNVKRALQSTEMDQQTNGSQAGAFCSGATPQTPACASAGGSTPVPTSPPGTTPSPTPSTVPATLSSIGGVVFIDTNLNNQKDSGEAGYSGAVINLTGSLTRSATTDSQGNFSFTSIGAGTYKVSTTISGQLYTTNFFIITTPVNVSLKIGIIPQSLTPTPVGGTNPTPTTVIIGPIIIPVPTSTPTSGGGPGGGGTLPTPTPQQTYSCDACSQSGTPPPGTVKIGQLCCTPN